MMHEQAAVHAADSFGRVTGKPAVVLAAGGAAATNCVTGLAEAFMDSVPLLLVVTNFQPAYNHGTTGNEIDFYSMAMPITKYQYRVHRFADLPAVLSAAASLTKEGRPGPVLLDLTRMETGTADADAFFSTPKKRAPAIAEKCLAPIVTQIKRAKKPVIIAGGGVIISGAADIVRKTAEKAGIPVVSTLKGLDAVPADHPLFLGMIGMHGTYAANKAVHSADLLICLGVRFNDRVTGKAKTFAPKAVKIHVDIDAAELNKNVHVDFPIQADISRLFLEVNRRLVKGDTSEWVGFVTSLHKKVPMCEKSNSILKPQHVIRMISDMTDRDAILTTDVGQHQIWSAHHYTFRQPRTFITSGGFGTMGFGLPAAIGAAIAAPHRQIVCVSGDGSFQMNVQEWMTVARYQLPIKVVILNNGYLGMVRQWQELFYNRRYSAVKIASPHFCALAEAYGTVGLEAKTTAEAREVIQTGLSLPGPVLMEFDVKEEENVYPMIPPGSGVEATIHS